MENRQKKSDRSDEIDLIQVIQYIWSGRWFIAKITGAFFILGLIIAFTSIQQYKAEARLLPEMRDARTGTSQLLRQLGGYGGLDIARGESIDAIRPELYPDVLKSTPFFLYLLEKGVLIETKAGREEVKVLDYVDKYMAVSIWSYVRKYTIRLPWTVAGWFRKGNEKEGVSSIDQIEVLPVITREQYSAIKTLRGRINADIDQRSGVVSVSAEFCDPKISAQIAQYALDYLTDYITSYRIEKAKKDLEFVKLRHDEKKEEFHQAQITLARFRDENQNIISAAVRTEQQRLEGKYNLAFNVYNGLAQQLEQARIKVQEETPVIKILEPVQVPMERSKPQRALIMVILVFLGGFIGVGVVFGRIIWRNICEQLRS